MGITEVLTVVFVVLKLIGKIDWSWWLVLLPEIIGIAFYVGLLILDISSRISLHRTLSRISNKKGGRNG